MPTAITKVIVRPVLKNSVCEESCSLLHSCKLVIDLLFTTNRVIFNILGVTSQVIIFLAITIEDTVDQKCVGTPSSLAIFL